MVTHVVADFRMYHIDMTYAARARSGDRTVFHCGNESLQ